MPIDAHRRFLSLSLCLVALLGLSRPGFADDPWIVFEGGDGPGRGQHIVLISGDDEYRSEEALPQLAKILSKHHGFRCTVLFPIDPADGTIKPDHQTNIPGTELVAGADLVILGLRFRNLPAEQMQPLVDYIESGKPIIGLRTSTHAFNLPVDSPFAKYSWTSRAEGYEGGFGKQVLGETWVAHHGGHGTQATRGIVAPGQERHPILRGIASGDIFAPSDVYTVTIPLPGDSEPLVLGEVVEGMTPDKPAAEGPKNDPMMPVAWTKTYTGEAGQAGRVFTTTMGAAVDLESAGLRRLLVNASYWCLGMEEQIPEESNVELVGAYKPTMFKFEGYQRGLKPADFAK
ncbi:MAG: ThuA domain-containing protein [Planctomyces sp.]|nr:ThuA domain-containing protein [Planctomyces sp.]